jgi:dTDP-4-amino-4,6-dideoxygalactose transaminase
VNSYTIPFNRPYLTGNEFDNIRKAHEIGRLSGDGEFTLRCQALIEKMVGVGKALLTHSCTAALEMSALLADVQPGDEIIMPSYTFVSTANAFVLRGGIPIFVDIREDTLNIDEDLIESAITPRTRAIVVVHYAGVACDMDKILAIAKRHNILVIEDAAQAIASTYKGRSLGGLGDLGCLSFHETKNVISGEGGALLIGNSIFADRSEIIREKGTDRSRFFRGQVDKYTWCDIGSSFLPGEITAAFLAAQLEDSDFIYDERMRAWTEYHLELKSLEDRGLIRRPIIPVDCAHNAHMYYVLTNSLDHRTQTIDALRQRGIQAVFHYVPLHSTPIGRSLGRTSSDMKNTDSLSDRLIRLPLWVGVDTGRVIDALSDALV